MTDGRSFYDGLAADYHLIFEDWWASATRQGSVLAGLLRAEGVGPPASVLDCTCGIGTQALPLAARGFRVTGTDLSQKSVERAGREAAARGIEIELGTSDVREIGALLAGRTFDAVISCDNSLPHLLTDRALADALAAIHGRVRPGGVFLASIRDYDQLVRDDVRGVIPAVRQTGSGRRITGQAWQWAQDSRSLTINLFVLTERDGQWQTTVHTATYRALRRAELAAAVRAAGFAEIRWLEAADIGYHQPVLIARRSAETPRLTGQGPPR